MLDESTLISNTLNGDIQSFALLVQAYQGQLYNFIYKMTKSKEDTEDILQDVFVKVYNNLYKYNNNYRFSTWIYSITLNTIKSSLKKKKLRPSGCNIDDFIEEIPSFDDSPELLIEVKEHYKEIIEIIDSLKEKQKTAFILRYIRDFSYKEIGKIMGISQEAAKMKVHRAKSILAKKIAGMRKEGDFE
ncbi:RNA polymerase sigma-70 factor (ECF subfamily) [Acetivibrio thermocellus AD2]|uniref:RNA polymerase sigma factor n=2 Tax=Acetivibrio thermocellus TaxID=1515 RepID=H6SHY2_ACETH|nr:RNA polymerase, sigma-24 subunit, ECF subfamily [Acetivibrio thermocellus DSM 1313]ALX09253.1 RNA polymerase, sigma-24 subunit, RpoE, ECF subfamily [Acetivibrio thermocellus AD2]ANV77005.1 RNA polymerase, sigma-24 subunit, RpoE, ECF subfamily [Acetivibrio thermocellus DSM 2360]EIC04721.1 RNA polymerase sigma factor, sigma-70 family [Acetivibrio thermocellus YS]CCF82160.1 alternative extracytoplasmic function sigma factor [Acetivibrio thermocellus]CDG36135.1 ECF subfamily RNA polymerase sigm